MSSFQIANNILPSAICLAIVLSWFSVSFKILICHLNSLLELSLNLSLNDHIYEPSIWANYISRSHMVNMAICKYMFGQLLYTHRSIKICQIDLDKSIVINRQVKHKNVSYHLRYNSVLIYLIAYFVLNEFSIVICFD